MNFTYSISSIEIKYKYDIVFNERIHVGDNTKIYNAFKECVDIDEFIDSHERMYAMFVDRALNLIAIMQVSEGNQYNVTVNSKKLGQAAILLNANGVILIHNHPSGNVFPSKNDHNTTESMRELLKILEVNLYDHIIVSRETFNSII